MVPPLGDVAVTFPDGARLAIEVQFGQITDNELLARRDDFAREGIGLVWVWHPDHQIPRVLFQFGEPGWVFDLAADRMGLACGRAHPGSRPNDIAAGLKAEAASTPRPPAVVTPAQPLLLVPAMQIPDPRPASVQPRPARDTTP
jgi:hypothetical protein